MPDRQNESKDFVLFRPVYEKLLGLHEIRQRRDSLRNIENLHEEKFLVEQAEHNLQREFIKNAKETLEKHYFEVAKPEIARLDDASWKKGVVMKAKEILKEKETELDNPQRSVRGSYVRISEGINKRSLLLERFAKSWSSLKKDWWVVHESESQSCESLCAQHFISAQRFFDLEDCYQKERERALFRTRDLQNYFRRTLLAYREKVDSSKKALWMSKAGNAFSISSDRVVRSFENVKETLRWSWELLLKQRKADISLHGNTDHQPSNRSLAGDFPDNHWSTEHFSTFRTNQVLSGLVRSTSNVRPDLHENMAAYELILLLRARSDMERIAMCEFLFQEQNSTEEKN